MTAKQPGSKSYLTDNDEILELDDAWFEKADLYVGDTLIRRGRPKGSGTKQQITLRLDKEVIDHFRATGDGWQSRINEALMKAIRKT
jgi:uncharacterized protein (DUF4415 family)